MRIVIAGSRNYKNFEEAEVFIRACLGELKKDTPFIFLSGGCAGADRIGEMFAAKNGYKIEKFPAEWERFGRAAGPIRNRKMAQTCDLVICFWDGKSRGTKSMISLAKEYGKPVKIKMI